MTNICEKFNPFVRERETEIGQLTSDKYCIEIWLICDREGLEYHLIKAKVVDCGECQGELNHFLEKTRKSWDLAGFQFENWNF